MDPDYALQRPQGTANRMSQALRDYRDARILDYGAGAGAFADFMKQLGFPNIASYDPFSMPDRPKGQFDIVLCIEVIEHSPSPRLILDDMLSFLTDEGCILIGESLQPPDIDRVRGNWWYVAPRNGHVSFFADRTLAALASQRGLVFHRSDGLLHVIRPRAAGRFAALTESMGPALECFRLGAPGVWPAEGFNGVEGLPGDQFQWTAASTISWPISLGSGSPRRVQVMIPYAHQSRANFAAECKIEVCGRSAELSIRESSMVAETGPIGPGQGSVALHTPPLKSAPGDSRTLGIALRVTAAPARGIGPPNLDQVSQG